jgi:DNA-binding IscR family transcriptional regulator
MADVVQIVEGDFAPVECLEEGGNSPCQRGDACAMRNVWCEIRDSVNAILARTTLQALAERRRSAIHFQI